GSSLKVTVPILSRTKQAPSDELKCVGEVKTATFGFKATSSERLCQLVGCSHFQNTLNFSVMQRNASQKYGCVVWFFHSPRIHVLPKFLYRGDSLPPGGTNMIVEEQISIVEEQIAARQQRARKTIQNILTGPVGQAYGDYVVKSASGKEYRVDMRGPSL